MPYVIVILLSYLIGSIPFGYVLTKLAGHGDIRRIGSGNIGATNVFRTGNKKIAFLTLLLDGAKGAAAVLIARNFYPDLVLLAAISVLLGHLFPVWLKFKGGKGVVTSVGVVTALTWPVGVVTMVIWTAVVKLSGYSSVGALAAIVFMPIGVLLWGRSDLEILTLIIFLLVLWKHSDNIRRLINGTESKIGKSKKNDSVNS